MFTGLVQATATVAACERQGDRARLVVDASHWTPAGGYQPAHGDSIAVSGVCLTLVEPALDRLSFDVIAQTLSHTTLGALKPGDRVNLEPAVLPSQPLGGHFMQGHVDGVGDIQRVQQEDGQTRITVTPPEHLMRYIIPQGSVAVDGVSLTLAAVGERSFDVALIPTTLELTTLGELRAGARVNLEADILAKTIVHQMQRQAAGNGGDGGVITWQTLQDAGFMDDKAAR